MKTIEQLHHAREVAVSRTAAAERLVRVTRHVRVKAVHASAICLLLDCQNLERAAYFALEAGKLAAESRDCLPISTS